MLSRVVTWGPANPGKSKLGEMFRRPMFAESRGEDLHHLAPHNDPMPSQ